MTLLSRVLLVLLSAGLLAQSEAQQTSPQTSQQTAPPAIESPWTIATAAGVQALGEDRYNDAEESFKNAIDAAKEDEDDPRLPAALNNLGVLYQRQGRYDEAEPLHRRALELREKILGTEHPDVAQSSNNLATVHVAQRQYPAALPLYERAIDIWQNTRGQNYYKIATALNNLATLYESQGQYEEARRYYDRALALWQVNRGGNDLLYAQSLENYAGLLRRINEPASAAKASADAEAIRAAVRERGKSVN